MYCEASLLSFRPLLKNDLMLSLAEALSEYDEDTIRFAEEELRRLNELIEAMEQDVRRRRLEIRADKCKAEYLRLWLRNVNGGTEG